MACPGRTKYCAIQRCSIYLSYKAFQKSAFNLVAMDKQPSKRNVLPSDTFTRAKRLPQFMHMNIVTRVFHISYSRSDRTRHYYKCFQLSRDIIVFTSFFCGIYNKACTQLVMVLKNIVLGA